MPDTTLPLEVRGFSRRDLPRVVIGIGGLLFLGAATWFLLPAIQYLLIPRMPWGTTGPWLIRPITAFHFGACAISSAILWPLLLITSKRKWRAADQSIGTRWDPYHNRRAKKWAVYVQGLLLVVVYSASLLFYLLSWTVIGQTGIEEHLPWGVRKHSYDQVRALEMIPAGFRSEPLAKDGPWDEVIFQNGRDIDFSLENEGTTAAEMKAIEGFVARRTANAWTVRTDAQPSR